MLIPIHVHLYTGHKCSAPDDVFHPGGQIYECARPQRAHVNSHIRRARDDGGAIAAAHDGVYPIRGRHLLPHQPNPLVGQARSIKRIAPHEGLGAGMRGHATISHA